MVNSIKGHKSPVGAMVYGTIAGDAWYRAQMMLRDQKLGHYMHIPPRTVFFSQLFGSFLGATSPERKSILSTNEPDSSLSRT
jgi:hypothetical protein